MTRPSWVALHGMAPSFTELPKPVCHNKAVVDMNLSKLQETVKDWEAWCAALEKGQQYLQAPGNVPGRGLARLGVPVCTLP